MANSFVKRNDDDSSSVIYPPNGIIPFYGFSMLGESEIDVSRLIDIRLIVVAPICFLYEEPVHLYFVFRSFYMKYLFKLQEISSSSEVIE